MANKIEKSLDHAFEDITPDVLDKILLHIDEREAVTATTKAPEKPVVVFSWRRWAAGIAAVLVLVFGGYFTYSNLLVESTINFDVNPSIQITVNRNEKILSATPLNEDAEIILDNMDLKNVDLDVAVNALIGSMLKNGYLSDIANSILISVENNDAEKAAKLQQRLSVAINDLLSAYAIDGSIISQNYTDKNKSIEALAEEYRISYSKAELIYKLVSIDPALAFADIAKLSVNDINLLIAADNTEIDGVTSDGNASSAAYIGMNAASEISLSHAGLTSDQVTFTKSKLDYEDGRMVYEIQFDSVRAEYDYEIDALTGDILNFDMDPFEKNDASGSSVDLERVSVDRDRAKEQDKEDNMARETDPDTADDMIEKKDGEKKIWEDTSPDYEDDDEEEDKENREDEDKDKEKEDDEDDEEISANKSGSYIGIESAQAIALNHAGLSNSEVNFTKTKLEIDDEEAYYEMKFTSDSTEYKYEIDALTGDILKAKS